MQGHHKPSICKKKISLNWNKLKHKQMRHVLGKQEIYLRFKCTQRGRVKKWENLFCINGNQKKVG